jgi:hypothetical protein
VKKILKNIGPINFENEGICRVGETTDCNINKHIPDNVLILRNSGNTPTDFKQSVITKYLGENYFDNVKKVLEIGTGWGRNAQWFMQNTPHIKYYGFDSSEVSLKYFRKQEFPQDRYYISSQIDKVILSQKYDFIFSTYTFQHIGFILRNSNIDIAAHDSISIAQELFPTLKVGGIWMGHEAFAGDNAWSTRMWVDTSFELGKITLISVKPCILEGSNACAHQFYLIQKLSD